MLKIRLMRIGAKKRPFYRVVAVDERAKRTGAYLELLGTYNPLTEPKDIKLKQDRIDHWIKQGAQMSTGFLRIIGKAPQRPPRKPKKQGKGESEKGKVIEETPTQEEHKQETKPPEETPKEESKPETEAEGAKVDEASRLSEAGEVSSESTSSDVHEPDRTVGEQSEPAELEKQDQPSDQSEKA